ncbi:MAG: NAD(P)H-dependent glycerol-3-phosphate dehydrogenase [Clostridiales bacterium]|jgi:glycerol-3-phosphate dehydrogenase (NAD(P)+)|nr:NAD(P)H-dependent glycerol-3-phosphate dehydrogenase [Clostridiales bacterium]
MKKICVIGSGGWGTAIALMLYSKGHDVAIWSFKKEEADSINKHRENKEFLKGIKIPSGIYITNDKEEAVNGKEILVIAVPSKFMRTTLLSFKNYISGSQIIANLSKGFEEGSLMRLSEVIEDVFPNNKICILSGPSHAEEVSRDIPTTVVAASKDISVAEYIQDVFMTNSFRIYTNTDVVGVELGAALKNVIALAAGVCDGIGYGDNTKAALMTRGLTEIARLGVKMGADKYTFLGLSGIGDLIVTCTSMHSRNRRAGILIGQGKTLEEALAEVHTVVEGVENAKAAYQLAQKYSVDAPIINQVYKTIFEGKDPKQAVHDLMTRGKTSEHAREDTKLDEI